MLSAALQHGERLTRSEFELKHDRLPHGVRAELFDGVVHIQQRHPLGCQRFNLSCWLLQYVAHTPGTSGGVQCSVRLDGNSEPQPDVVLIVDPANGGQAQIDTEDFLAGGPELVADVVAAIECDDLEASFAAYRRNNVKEYVVWRVLDQAIDWFVLHDNQYVPLPCESGVYRSRVFPGLWLDVQALMTGDLLKVFEVVQQGVRTPEHQHFVESMKLRRQ